MLREKQKTKTLKHWICIANSLVSFFGDVTSGSCFAFCLFFSPFALNFCFSLSGDDLQFKIGRWKSSSSAALKSFPSVSSVRALLSKYGSFTRCFQNTKCYSSHFILSFHKSAISPFPSCKHNNKKCWNDIEVCMK